jgi:hypothetical protein
VAVRGVDQGGSYSGRAVVLPTRRECCVAVSGCAVSITDRVGARMGRVIW